MLFLTRRLGYNRSLSRLLYNLLPHHRWLTLKQGNPSWHDVNFEWLRNSLEHPREGDSSILLRHVDEHVVHWAPQLAELLGAPRVVTSRDGHQFS